MIIYLEVARLLQSTAGHLTGISNDLDLTYAKMDDSANRGFRIFYRDPLRP